MQLDKDPTVTEWMHLKQAGRRLRVSSVFDLVQVINTLIKMLELTLPLPLSSADCERGFPHLSRIKTKYRSGRSHARLSA